MDRENITETSYLRSKKGSRVRKIFFLLTAFWGYFLGIATLGIVIKCFGRQYSSNPLCWLITLVTIIAAGLGSLVFCRAYMEYKKRKSVR